MNLMASDTYRRPEGKVKYVMGAADFRGRRGRGGSPLEEQEGDGGAGKEELDLRSISVDSDGFRRA